MGLIRTSAKKLSVSSILSTTASRLAARGAATMLGVCFCALCASSVRGQVPTISTLAGGGLPVNGPATSAGLSQLGGITRDPAGNLYFVSYTGTIERMDLAGNLTIFAGTGPCCFSGDGGPATSAQLGILPAVPAPPVKADSAGNIYIADYTANVVRRIDHTTGIITTVAGTPNSTGFSGAGGLATNAQISPFGMGFDASDNLFISDINGVVWRVDHVTQIITTVAGNGTSSGVLNSGAGDGGPATSAQLNGPSALAVDTAGDLFIATVNRVRRVDAVTQIITTVAGGGATSPATGVLATQAQLGNPTGLAFDPGGNLLIADAGLPAVIRVDQTTQNITVIAGDFTLGPGFSGDGGPATSAQLGFSPFGNGAIDLAVDSVGDIFVTDGTNYRVRRIDAVTNTITTVAGNGTVGDGGLATSAQLFASGIATDSVGNVLISDPVNRRVRRVDGTTRLISTVAGSDVNSTPVIVNGVPATAALLAGPGGMATDSSGNIFIMDSDVEVRRVDASTGIISLFAGGPLGGVGFGGDGGPATSAKFDVPRGLATDSAGNLYIADTGNNVVRRVDAASQIITTVAGNTAILSHGRPAAGYSGDGGPATLAQLTMPVGLLIDSSGNLFISDAGNNVIRRVDAISQIITTVVGNTAILSGGRPAPGYSGDGGPALAAQLSGPRGLAMDTFGNIYFGDNNNFRVRTVNAVTGIITTLAGNGILTYAGDGAAAANASCWPLGSLAALPPDDAGNIRVLVQDEASGRVRDINIPPVPAVFFNTSSLSFAGTSSAAQFATIVNSGTGTLNVTNVAVTGAQPNDFVVVPGGSCNGTSFALAPTASCTVAVQFSPTALGLRSAALAFADNGAGSPQAISLLGVTGNLTVSAGQTFKFTGGTISGDVSINGGNLILNNVTVGGNITMTGGTLTLTNCTVQANLQISSGTFQIDPTRIRGNLQVQDLPASSVTDGICGVSIGGNLRFQQNAAPIDLGSPSLSCKGNTIGGNLQIMNDAARVQVFDNTVGGSLLIMDNTGQAAIFNNMITNNLQCQDNSSISGGMNTAKEKKGQCASF